MIESQRKSKLKHHAKNLIYGREYARKRDPVKLRAYQKQWRKANRDRVLATSRRYYAEHREKRIACTKASFQKHREKHLANNRLRRKNDPLYGLGINARVRISTAARGLYPRSPKTVVLLGCTVAFFRDFLAAQFNAGMTWENYGKHWQIDHIIPVSFFDLSDMDQRKRAFHYSNCRPLEKSENIRKKDKMPEPHQALLI